jgi:hypothetical protein
VPHLDVYVSLTKQTIILYAYIPFLNATSSSLHVSDIYGNHIFAVLLQLLHCMSKLRIVRERDISYLK